MPRWIYCLGSQISPSLAYEVIVSFPLFFSRFPTTIRLAVRKYCSCGHAIDRPVVRFGCSPLLYHDYWPASKFRCHSVKVLSRKKMIASFADLGHRTPREFMCLHNVVSTVALAVLYCTLYRIQKKCGVHVEVSMNGHASAFTLY